MANKSGKARAFAFLIYPESWQTWESDLKALHMPIVVSPLHDRDVWTEADEEQSPEHVAGTPKKPHRHAIISWGNSTTIKAVLNVLEPYGVQYVDPVGSYSAYCRYLLHLDDPEKAQYDSLDVVCISGGIPDFERKLTRSEMLAQRDEIMELCVDNCIVEYAILCGYCKDHRPDWREEVYTNTVFWRGYLSSLRHMPYKTQKEDAGDSAGL